MKKVLTFIDWFWPGYKAGGPIRSLLNLTENLSKDIAFYIVTRDTDYMSSIPYTNIKCDQWNEISPNIFVYYISKNQLSIKKIKSFLLKDKYDKVYINGMYSYYFSIIPLVIARLRGLNTIVSPRGMLSGQTFSSKKGLKKLYLFALRKIGLYNTIEFHATIKKESDDISKQLNIDKSRIKVAPNLPRKLKQKTVIVKNKTKGQLKLISIARISPEKNTLYAIKALSKLDFGETIFDLFGEIYIDEYWKECKMEIDKLPANVKVNYKGSLQGDKIPETIENYHFLLMPSKGENFGHSILESLMAGTPVIISQNTPWRSLSEIKAGWDISLDDVEEFEKVLKYCLEMDSDTYKIWSEGAFNKAQEFLNDKDMIRQSKHLFIE